jgi:hypothetical protein
MKICFNCQQNKPDLTEHDNGLLACQACLASLSNDAQIQALNELPAIAEKCVALAQVSYGVWEVEYKDSFLLWWQGRLFFEHETSQKVHELLDTLINFHNQN